MDARNNIIVEQDSRLCEKRFFLDPKNAFPC